MRFKQMPIHKILLVMVIIITSTSESAYAFSFEDVKKGWVKTRDAVVDFVTERTDESPTAELGGDKIGENAGYKAAESLRITMEVTNTNLVNRISQTSGEVKARLEQIQEISQKLIKESDNVWDQNVSDTIDAANDLNGLLQSDIDLASNSHFTTHCSISSA